MTINSQLLLQLLLLHMSLVGIASNYQFHMLTFTFLISVCTDSRRQI